MCSHKGKGVYDNWGIRCVLSFICCPKWEFKYSRRCRSVQSPILLLWCVIPCQKCLNWFHEMSVAEVGKKQFRLRGIYDPNQSASNSPIRELNSPAHFHESEYCSLYCHYFSLPMIVIFSLIVYCIVLFNKWLTIDRHLCKLKTFNQCCNIDLIWNARNSPTQPYQNACAT